MNSHVKGWAWGFASFGCIALIVGLIYIYGPSASGEGAARKVVADFGDRLKNVSILSPQAPQEINQQYGAIVTPELLAQWQVAPNQAPGRATSSPWPERIDVTGSHAQGQTFIVTGTVVYLSSEEEARGGTAGSHPIIATVVHRDRNWLIASYQEMAVPQ